ncbi:uncharacterized protein LOC113329874 [Papaver somniferum]|uniref:uncharacterized protein LOC113329874 n=1 Tax=Papaver somniferum TaxID=3469 RepID=UPI000E7024C5|nr:uncharacterized protein LOC113329874 [Papaver somniferum]
MVKKGEGKTFTLRGFNVTHTCNGDKDDLNKLATPKYVAGRYYEKMKTELGINEPVPCPDDLATQFNKARKVNIRYHTAWRARVKVLEKLHGNYEKSYSLVPTFCEMVKYGTIPENIHVIMFVDDKSRQKIIGLDGCHLNGKFGGVMLHATGLDGQNGLVPLGIMVCRNEKIENWKIFLEDLKKLLGDDHEFTFISDKQKGILEGVYYHFPLFEHRQCVRHLMANFKKYYKGYSIQTHLWNAAKCYKIKHFNVKQHMDDMAAESIEVARFLMDERPETWSRAHFPPTSKCEHINNNFSESFNNMAKNIRDKPISKLGLMYGQLVMGLLNKRRNEAAKWKDGDLVPKAMQLITKMCDLTINFQLESVVRGKVYEVTSCHGAIFVVEFPKRTCSCLQWKLRGFVCQHVVCALKPLRPVWADHCDKYYWVDIYKRTYASEFNPFLGPEDYEKTALKEMMKPPVNIRKAVGSNPKVPKARTCVDGDTFTSYESGPSKRNKKGAKVVHGSSAGQSTSVRGATKTKSNIQSCVGESYKQAVARSEKGVKGKATRKFGSSQTSCMNQNFKNIGSVSNNVTFTVSDPKSKKKTKKYMKI